MTMLPQVRRFFRIDRGAVDVPVAVADELQFHFDMTIEELVARGMSRDEATREAHRRFGDVERTRRGLQQIDRERVTQERRAQWWSGLSQDLRYALRGLRLSPGFTLGVMLTLGLGIGANATMFSIIDPLLFRTPAHLANPQRTNRVYVAALDNGKEYFRSSFSYKQFLDFTSHTTSFTHFVAYWSPSMAIGNGIEARESRVTGVSAAFWQLFPVVPEVGRLFNSDEDRVPAGEPVVVLSWPFWQSEFGGARDAIGKHLRIGKFDYTIIGVAPRDLLGFQLGRSIGFIPITSVAANTFEERPVGRRYYDSYSMNWITIAAERKVGVSEAAATADLQRAVVQSYQQRLDAEPRSTPLATLQPRAMLTPVQAEAGPNRSTSTKVGTWLVGVALLVLLIACANVGNLLLARALRRRREIALRLALGVTRGRLLAQLLTESLLLAFLGAALGLGIAATGGTVLSDSLMPDAKATGGIVDARMLIFAGCTMLFAALLCGIAPAAMVLRANLAGALKSGAREGGYHRSRLRVTLLVLQGALSVLLLVGAGLFVSSLRQVRAQPLGYDAEHVSYVEQNMRGTKLSDDERYLLLDRLLARAEQLPGVVAASRTTSVPFHTDWEEDIFVPGVDSISKRGSFVLQAVSGGYFKTMGTRVIRGRELTDADRAGTEKVIVVSQSMARIIWGEAPALGKCVKLRADSLPCYTVVGVAEDIKRGSLSDDPGLMYYVPISQFPSGAFGIFVRTRAPAVEVNNTLRRALQPEMPGSAYITVDPLPDLIAPEMRSWQLGATMFTVFGGLALIVASIGLYSVVAYTVTQRRQEMGVRVALGASARSVLQLIVGDALRMMLLAVGIGLAAALLTGRWVAPLLFQTSPRDPVVLSGVVVTLLLVGVGASLLPAWRAATTDPVTALRSE
ncbi:MAG: ADOP family duplicated permease [Gemmatimonadales bacterium]